MEKTGYPSIDRTHLQGIPEDKLHPKILPLSMLAIFWLLNHGHMNEPCIITRQRIISKGELKANIKDFIGRLLKLGIKTGDKVAITAPNCYEAIVATFGANAIGASVVMLEPKCNHDLPLLQEELGQHRPKLLIAYGKEQAWRETVKRSNPYLVECLVIETPEPSTKTYNFVRDLAMGEKSSNLAITLTIWKHFRLAKDQPMLYLKTSGSTSGKPKTLPFDGKAIFAALIYVSNSTGTVPRDPSVKRVLCNAPFSHGYGWMTLFCNILGGNAVILTGSTKEEIAKYYRFKPTYIYGTSLILKHFMSTLPEDEKLDYLTKFFCAGATIPEEEYEEGMAFFKAHHSDAQILNNYGISEGLCIGTAPDLYPHVKGSIGKFTLGPEWILVDEELNEVKYGQTGEAIVAADSLCLGYFNDPQSTKDAFITWHGWRFFRTGDYMSLSEDGYVHFVGRNRRFFFTEGVTDKVNCETIEQALDNLSIIDSSAIVIAKDEQGTEYAKAFVVLDETKARQYLAVAARPVADQSDHLAIIILSELKKTLEPYQAPKEFVFVKELPYMDSGKINYQLLETI